MISDIQYDIRSNSFSPNSLQKTKEPSLNLKMEQKNFGLDPGSFEKLVADLRRNETVFFEQVFLKQFKETTRYLCRTYGTSEEEAYDATMDTLIEFRTRFVEGKLQYGNLRFLFTKMASQVLLRNLKRQTVNIDGLFHLTEEDPTPQNTEELEWLQSAWKQLCESCKQLLTSHFYGRMKLSEIAVETQKSPAAIRKQKERCVKQLKEQFSKKANIQL